MGLIKEPKNVDLIIKSEPWTDKEVEEFREIMRAQKLKRRSKKRGTAKGKSRSAA